MKDFDLSLYLVLDPVLCGDLGMIETTRAAVAGGATIVQLRDKHAPTAAVIETGRALKKILQGTNARLIVNDNVEAAIAIGADGLHIGQEDMNAAKARRRIGPDMILGLSVETEVLATLIDPGIVDYAGIGPVFATPTKPDHKQPIGFDGLARIVGLCPVPSVAIGGLKVEHTREVFSVGADGLAVVSAICGQADPRKATALIANAIKEARQ
ncbi:MULTISPECIES: thiamine phosphate synthase [Rhizobium]|jgi:thiamine-phosphate pyrophosphorylase|uniref:Thiamine-phosphate synthase n=1 Tax=Rhizobium tropici TaxID=398 RepID=A0A329Y9A5_RHITR|nr:MULTISPECIES: thiamine phosphate synthase [Rhizobium]MBB3285635.1 thiamine-phosphate pyrophosphorylase [Rhizobium sp. BK252]MBB3400375.1 thiamine-phosphate pyrophosphorylase [Rhizobium sp. BK289]MBB3412954.1 thiamine-phosphate pyrophosphorylase [Rhizobium sp. BK284]MBB3480841.1 thiamine-phosphate pyrophosphorylase [Rhizobium sp. BK347]MDK4721515.1 thiamine phosphate synthase [Rhizobium sp. CNPSo 3968]